MNKKFDYVISAIGSGGTYGGLYLAKKLEHWGAEIVGVNVCDTAEYFKKRIAGILTEIEERFRFGTEIEASELKIVDGFVGPGYSISTPEERELMKLVARSEGIFLDPVYTGKAFWAMDHLINTGEIALNSNVLFLHTGGIFGLYPQKEQFFDF